MDITVEIMAEVLAIIGMATKEVKWGRMSELTSALVYDCCCRLECCLEKYLKKLIGNMDIKDSLHQLDKLTQEKARMASAEQLRIAYSVEERVKGVDDRVQGINRKLDATTCSLSLTAHALIPNTQTYSQGTYSATTFYDGFRLRIHPSIITSHPKPITMVQPSGSFRAVFSTNGSLGSLLVRLCGYMENMCFSSFQFCHINPNHFNSIAGSGKSILWLVLPLLVQPYQTHTLNLAPLSYKIL